jgi:hypothetical protein
MTADEKDLIVSEVLLLHGSITHEAAQSIADYIEQKFSGEPNPVHEDPPQKEQLDE